MSLVETQIDLEEAIAAVEPRTFLDGRVRLFCGDCLEVLKTIPDNSIDSAVMDPPYHLTSIVKRFGGKNAAAAQFGKDGAFARASAGFMGKQWDGGDIAFRIDLWAEVLRVLKPGGHLVAFSGTRTYHRMACAIEDAGFEIRDQIGWAYGSGFPKSHDVSKGIDKAAGAEREFIGVKPGHEEFVGRKTKGHLEFKDGTEGFDRPWMHDDKARENYHLLTAPTTDAAKQWQGWGTALKPAWEPICVARKPLIGTVAENVLTHGTGALNIDGCRVEIAPDDLAAMEGRSGASTRGLYEGGIGINETWKPSTGRWPANLIHDGSDEVRAAFPDAPGQIADAKLTGERKTGNVYGKMTYSNGRNGEASAERRYTDQGSTNFAALPGARREDGGGSAARFFYTAKADAEDRLGSKHPTVKPLDLMQYLVRLVTPKGGTVLDCFAGTGTTGEAAWREGMQAILIEREEEYQADIARRMDLADKPTKRAAVAKTKNNLDDPNSLPLFVGGK